jgi:hypothetical protein
MQGHRTPYVPGWDCHGMPIEVQIEKKHGKNLPAAETQRLCRAFATEQIVVPGVPVDVVRAIVSHHIVAATVTVHGVSPTQAIHDVDEVAAIITQP